MSFSHAASSPPTPRRIWSSVRVYRAEVLEIGKNPDKDVTKAVDQAFKKFPAKKIRNDERSDRLRRACGIRCVLTERHP